MVDTGVREVVDTALQHLRKGEVATAIELYDRARELTQSDELLELISIRKAEALLAAELDGPEIALLPQIVMRRRCAQHVYLAAYALMRKFADGGDRRRALFYGDLARKAAAEAGDPRARANVLNGLGITLTADSRFVEAIDVFEEALHLASMISDAPAEVRMLRAFVCGNLGGAQILNGRTDHGIMLVEEAIPEYQDDYSRAESYVDLAFGYMHLEDYASADAAGQRALECASVPRQVRNANHVLAEVAARTGRAAEAAGYYDVVASFYPEFKNVKELLLAVDVLSVVNWKA